MPFTVAEIAALCRAETGDDREAEGPGVQAVTVDLAHPRTHCYVVKCGDRTAVLSCHDGEGTEIDDADIKKQWRRLGRDGKAFVNRLRRL